MMEDKVPALYAAKAGKIKGHIKLELFDASTNALVQSTEADNLVTDAVGYTVTHLAACSKLSSGLPIDTNIAGGIYLFDNELSEDASDFYFPPAEAHLTAFADRGTNTDNAFMGSLNSLESGATDTGYVSVWDFSTSQANGTIASAALTWNTSSLLAPYGVRNVFYFRDSSNSYSFSCLVLHFDHDSDTMYFVLLNNSGSTFTAELRKAHIPADRFWVGDPYYSSADLTSISCQTKTFTSSNLYTIAYYNNTSFRRFFHWGYDGYTYLVYTLTSGGDTFYYTRMVLDTSGEAVDFTIELDQEVTCSGCTFSKGFGAASNGYFYIPNSDMSIIYQIPMNNTANVKEISISSSGDYIVASSFSGKSAFNFYSFEPQPKGGVRFNARSSSATSGVYSYHLAFLQEDGTVFINGAAEYTSDNTYYLTDYLYPNAYMSDRLLGWGGYDQDTSLGYVLRNFMATKANLEDPIVKNASQTLKVTYTLTDS